MGGLLATLAFAYVGWMLIKGGVQTMASGLEVSKGKTIRGPAGTAVGVTLIVLGVGLTIGAAIYFW